MDLNSVSIKFHLPPLVAEMQGCKRVVSPLANMVTCIPPVVNETYVQMFSPIWKSHP